MKFQNRENPGSFFRRRSRETGLFSEVRENSRFRIEQGKPSGISSLCGIPGCIKINCPDFSGNSMSCSSSMQKTRQEPEVMYMIS